MADETLAIEKLTTNGIITPTNVCYETLRNNLRCSKAESKPLEDVQQDTEYGRAILQRKDQLAAYWFTYAPMIKEQWETFWHKITPLNINGSFEIIDHGCGQGLASCLFLDKHGKRFAKKLSKITLIEPSNVAIETAGKILDLYSKKFGHQIKIRKVRSKIDEINPREIISENNRPKLHLLSNILDVDSFDPVRYFQSLLSISDSQRYFCVSHSRDYCGGNSRFRKVEKLFNRLSKAGSLEPGGPAQLDTFNFRPTHEAIYLCLSKSNDK